MDVAAGNGLEAALAGVDAVVDVLNTGTTSGRAAREFFGRTTDHLLTAAQAAGVGHHVALSIVGVDGATTGYYAGKVEQERRVAAGPVPWTLLRATQFHEFAGQIARRTAVGPVVVVPAMRTATIAAVEVAGELARLAAGTPQGRVADLAGPLDTELADLVRRELAAGGGRRVVLRVPLPGSAGRRMRAGLLPGSDARRTGPTFDEWLSHR